MSDSIKTQAADAPHLFQLFERSAATYGDGIALKADGGRGRAWTYAQVSSTVRRVAAGLSAAPYSELSEVGLLSENRPEWPIAYLAILAAGKVVVPIDANYKPAEIVHIVTDARLKLVFCSGQFEQLLGGIVPGLNVLSFEPDSPSSWRAIEQEPERDWSPPAVETAVLIYTSGTTGAPKVVVLTHRNLISNLEGVERALQFDNQDVFLSVLPLHHTFEATCGFLTPLTNGCTIVYARSLKSKEILEDFALNGVTIMCGVPLLFEKMHHAIMRRIQEAPVYRRLLFKFLFALSSVGWMLRQKWGVGLFRALRKKAGLSTLRMLVSGGAPLPPDVARFFNLIGIDFMQGYGMTECSPVISVNRPDDIEFGSVGLPLANLEVRIDQPDEQGIGEILVRGDSVTPGYLNNPEKTAELLVDGWLRTGDLGRFQRNHLWITGRRKNVIISAAGKNVYPEELEEKLLASPYVLEALVFGRQKEGKQGEEVRALIYPDFEQFRLEFGLDPAAPDLARVKAAIQQVVAEINAQLADFKRIVAFDVRAEEFEKTSTRKIMRYKYSQPLQRPGDIGEK